MLKDTADISVGIVAPIVIGLVTYYLSVDFCCFQQEPEKGIIGCLSRTCLIFNLLSLFALLLTFYSPYITENFCGCDLYWKISLVTYISGIYCVKFKYALRVFFHLRHLTKKIEVAQKVIIGIMSLYSVCYIVIISVQFVTTSGECHENKQFYGCQPKFANSNMLIAIAFMCFDLVNFFLFSRLWHNKLRNITEQLFRSELMIGTDEDDKLSISRRANDLLDSFYLQMRLVALALIGCIVDGVLNMAFKNYPALVIFVIDNLLLASCNFFHNSSKQNAFVNTCIKCNWKMTVQLRDDGIMTRTKPFQLKQTEIQESKLKVLSITDAPDAEKN